MRVNFEVVLKSDRSCLAYEGVVEAVTEWLKQQPDVREYMVYSPITQKYYSVPEFLQGHIFPSHFSDLMPKYYTMDPKTDDLLPNGMHLSNGMKVMVGDPDNRHKITPAQLTQDWQLDRALEANRWCVISHLEIIGNNVRFVGIYDDGSKRSRNFSVNHSWLVKLDSMSDAIVQASERYNKVLKLTKEAFEKNEELVSRHDYPAKEINTLVEETARKILGLL